MSNRYLTFCICLGLILVTFIAYEQVRYNGFVNYDDRENIVENQYISDGLSVRSLRWAFSSGGRLGDYNPLTWLTHIIDCSLYGLEPAGHHITNVLFHAANTILFFVVLKIITNAVWPSAFVALLFAVHPLHVESVAWVTERRDVLYCFFWILAIWAYYNYTKRPSSFVRYIVVLLIFAASLLSKSMAVTLPFVLLLIDYWPLERISYFTQSDINDKGKYKKNIPEVSLSRLIVEKVPLLIMSAVVCIITYLQNQRVGSLVVVDKLPLLARTGNAFNSYVKYILMVFWPGKLAVFYPHPGAGLPVWQAVVSLIILVTISGGVIYFARRRRYLVVGWFWYLGTLIPTIGIVQAGNQAHADRYTYVPLIGLFIMIAWGLGDLLARWHYKKVVRGAFATIVAAVLLVCTRTQVGYWRNDFTLFGHALKVTENNYLAHNMLGYVLQSQGKYDEAIGYIERALEMRPDAPGLRTNLGNVLKSQGKIDEAIKNYYKALEIEPDNAHIYLNLGQALRSKGKYDEAISCFKRVVELNPDYSRGHFDLGLTFQLQRKFDDAADSFQRALNIEPDNIHIHYNLGLVLQARGRFSEAIGHFQRVLESQPDNVSALTNTVLILAVHPDPKERDVSRAIKLGERTAELTGRGNARVLKALAVAYAAAGQFNRAVRAAERALRLAAAGGDDKLADSIRRQLERYKQGKP